MALLVLALPLSNECGSLQSYIPNFWWSESSCKIPSQPHITNHTANEKEWERDVKKSKRTLEK